jgi:dihydroorotase
MSKFLALGLGLGAVIGASTAAPAAVLGREELGHLAVGAVADAAILELVDGEFDYRDVLGESRRGRHWLAVRGLVVGGRVWRPPEQ